LQGLLKLASGIDRVTRFFGIVAALLVAVSCLISALNALSRYALDVSSNAFLEIQWQMFAGMFLLGSAHVLRLNEHVRVDLFYGGMSDRNKLWVDVFGFIVFFFPLCFIMLDMGFPWAVASMPTVDFSLIWKTILGIDLPWFSVSVSGGETSANAGGLPVWPAKLLLPLGYLLLTIQGVAELIRRIAALLGVSYEKPVQ
jgi:TRAP-type mannitol/chloroaromatic compound transport system permease small subunit